MAVSSERLSNLPKITQLINTQSRPVLLSLCSSWHFTGLMEGKPMVWGRGHQMTSKNLLIKDVVVDFTGESSLLNPLPLVTWHSV